MARMLDVEKLREDTPGCSQVVHFENAGSALLPTPVINAVNDYFRLECKVGGYRAYNEQQGQIESLYQHIGKLINSPAEQIAFAESATRAWCLSFYSIDFKAGDVILASMAEYGSNFISMLQLKEKIGLEIKVIPNDELGQVDMQALESLLDERVKLVAITHTPTNGGLVNPVEDIGKLVSGYPAYYLIDACQTVGQYPLDVAKLKCDFLTATGRKYLRGPRGTGFLYVSKRVLDEVHPVFLDLYSAKWSSKDKYRIEESAKRFEQWEKNFSNVMGLSAAVQYLQGLGIENVWESVSGLANSFREQLSRIPGVVLTDSGKVKCGIVTFYKLGVSCDSILATMIDNNINISDSTPFGTRLDMEHRGLERVIRASLHYYNTQYEIEKFCSILEKIN